MPEINELNEALLELQQELDRLRDSASLLGEARVVASEVISAAQGVKDATESLAQPLKTIGGRLEKATKRLEQIDFPARLDKLDATTSALGAAIQNVLARIDSSERNLKDSIDSRHKDIKAVLTETAAEITSQLTERIRQRVDGAQKSLQGHVDTSAASTKQTLEKRMAENQKELAETVNLVRNWVIGSALVLAAMAVILHFVR